MYHVLAHCQLFHVGESDAARLALSLPPLVDKDFATQVGEIFLSVCKDVVDEEEWPDTVRDTVRDRERLRQLRAERQRTQAVHDAQQRHLAEARDAQEVLDANLRAAMGIRRGRTSAQLADLRHQLEEAANRTRELQVDVDVSNIVTRVEGLDARIASLERQIRSFPARGTRGDRLGFAWYGGGFQLQRVQRAADEC
jgi:hypothetical protein